MTRVKRLTPARSPRGFALCPHCCHRCWSTGWFPGSGLDPRLREFECLGCKIKFYDIIAPKEGLR